MPLEETPLDPALSRWHLLGSVLRLLRHEKDESLMEVADHLAVSFQTISNWEHARARMNAKYARKLDARWETGGLLELHQEIAMEGQKPHQFSAFTRFEGRATGLRIFGLAWVPGLLQTPDYARAVLDIYNESDLDTKLAERMERQQILTRESPPKVWIILDEGVLDRCVGSPEIMRDQITRLLEIGERPNITLRVVPREAGGHQGLNGEFHLMSEGGRSAAFVAAPGGGFLVQGGAMVETFTDMWEAIGVHALPWDGSKELLKKALEAYQ